MALPADVTRLGTFKGDKGDKGEPGTFASASAATVSSGEPAKAIISGPNGQNVHFEIPRGLPGTNGVATDEAVALNVDGWLATETGTSVSKATGMVGGGIASALTGTAMEKAREGATLTVIAQGDSTVYGHDDVSPDQVPATGAADDGTPHTQPRTPVPWPAAMEGMLNEYVLPGTVSVINQGFSGDTTVTGFDRWPINHNADIAFLSYGINDALVSGGITVEAYIQGYRRLIERFLAWGTSVVIVLPTKMQGKGHTAAELSVDVYRRSLVSLAQGYGLPIVDGQMLLANAARDSWGTTTHPNAKGYNTIGRRMAGVVMSPDLRPLMVYPGSKLLPRQTMDGFWIASGIWRDSSGVPTPDENVTGQGQAVGLTNGSCVWTFYTATPDMVVYPYIFHDNSGASGPTTILMALDFGAAQGENYHDLASGQSSAFTPTAATVTKVVAAGETWYNNDPKAPDAVGLRITTPGWHTIRIQQTAGAGSPQTLVHALEFLDNREYRSAEVDTVWIPGASLTPTVGSPTVGVVGLYPALMFDGVATESAAQFASIPAGWRTYDIEVWRAPADAATGSIDFQMYITNPTDGAAIPNGAGSMHTVSSGGVANRLTVATAVTAAIVPTNRLVGIRLVRAGGSATDTYNADVGVIGIRLVRKS